MTKDIRDNRQYCAICYFTPAAITGFGLSVPNGAATIIGLDTNCGVPGGVYSSVVFSWWYLLGLLGTYVNGGSYDHILIPGGQCDSPAANAVLAANFLFDRYCQTQLGCGTNAIGTAQTAGTVCTNQKPFQIGVVTDGVEWHFPTATSEAGAPRNIGFSLSKNYLISR